MVHAPLVTVDPEFPEKIPHNYTVYNIWPALCKQSAAIAFVHSLSTRVFNQTCKGIGSTLKG